MSWRTRRPSASLRRGMILTGGLGLVIVLGGAFVFLGVNDQMRSQLIAASDARAEEQAIADRVTKGVMRQLLLVSSMRVQGGAEQWPAFRAAGDTVYTELHTYLLRDLNPDQRLQLEALKQSHQELEVTAARATELLGRGILPAAQASFDSIPAHVMGALGALDTLLQMREAGFADFRRKQARAFQVIRALGAVFGLLLLAGATVWGRFMFARVDRPLRDLVTAARRMEEGDLATRVPEARDAEFATVAESLNTMAGSLAQDIANRKRAEAALRASEERYRGLIEHAVIGVYQSDLAGRFLAVNPALVNMLGYASASELMAVNIESLYLDPSARAGLIGEHASRTGIVEVEEVEWKRKDGKPVTVRLRGRSIRHLDGTFESFEMFAEDVTERRAIEAQLRHSQKMEAVGQLTGGITHDFNNLLTVILSYSQIGLDDLPPSVPLRDDLREIHNAAARAAQLTRQLLAFSRRQILTPVVINLNDVVAPLEQLLRRVLGEPVLVEMRLAAGLGNVEADLSQVEQVIVNLAVNARDAMPNGGKLAIETANVVLDESYAERHVEVLPGRYVMLSVTDTGTGMSAAIRERIFEPFFTTKAKGQGTGLGLATVYGIVKQSGGHIWVYSEPGHGTTFKVYLPRVDKPVTASDDSVAAVATTGTETILVAEDEEAVRRSVERILTHAGYQVFATGTGNEAIRLCEEHRDEIALLLTDLVMPGMSGRTLEQQARTIVPTLRVLFMSGYADNAAVQLGGLDPGSLFVSKPFAGDDLLRKVREALDIPVG